MKTESLMASGCSRSIARYASILAITFVASSAATGIGPVFAESDPSLAANIVTVQQDAPLVEQDYPSVPDMGEDVSPPSYESDLTPAPVEPYYRGTSPEPEAAPFLGGSAAESPGVSNSPWMVPPESRFAQPFNPAPAGGFSALPPVGAAGGFSGAPQGFYGRNH